MPEELSPCPHCKEKNPAGSPLCYHCGRPLIKPDMIHLDHRSAFDLTGDADTINSALKGLFFKRLKTFVEDVLGNAHYSEYVDMYYASEMQKKFETKAKVIAESVVRHQASGTREDRIRSDSQVLHFLKSMVLYHVIVYGKAYHTCNLPEKILWYQDVAPGRLPLLEMIQDFLDLEREHLICYQDFIAMPVEKMKNAALSFLSAAPEEKVFFICDLSLFGNGKEGFAMTQFGLYWKSEWNKARKIWYHDLTSIARKDDHLLINGHFFHVNPCLDIKMHLLLLQLRDIFSGNDVH